MNPLLEKVSLAEVRFFHELSAEFLREHPREDGWRPFRMSERLQSEADLDFLVNFLAEEHAQCVRRSETVDEVATDEFIRRRDQKKGAGTGRFPVYRWSGRLDLEWAGNPIHLLRVAIPIKGEVETFVAAKSEESFLAVMRAVHVFAHRDVKTGKGRVRTRFGDVEEVGRSFIGWDDLILPPGMTQDIRGNVESFLKPQTRKMFEKARLPYRRGFLLMGPAGCGKTMTIRAIVNTVDAECVFMNGGRSKYELVSAIHGADAGKPVIVILEDLDRLSGELGEDLSFILNELDGLTSKEGLMFLATANAPDKIDAALLHRPSRFDRVWRYPLPGPAERHALLTARSGGVFSTKAVDDVVRRTNGFTLAYLQEVFVGAMLASIADGAEPADHHLMKSLEAISTQRASASKPLSELSGAAELGFHQPA